MKWGAPIAVWALAVILSPEGDLGFCMEWFGGTIQTPVHLLLGYTDADGWRPGIGDPTLMGWVTVGAYFAAAVLCARSAWLAGGLRLAEGRFWGFLSGALVFLGFNKQLDLQTWFTLTGKKAAIAQGWYEHRRIAQGVFILAIAAGGLWLMRWLWRTMRRAPGSNWLALAGFIFLGCFILVRAASFHHMDLLLKSEVGGVRMNWVFELAGITMLGAAAWHRAAVLAGGAGAAGGARTAAPEGGHLLI